jgi:hypothetical protein
MVSICRQDLLYLNSPEFVTIESILNYLNIQLKRQHALLVSYLKTGSDFILNTIFQFLSYPISRLIAIISSLEV